MVTPRLVGPIAQRFRRDEEGHRFYEIDWHVQTFSQHDNLAYILANWPLFAVGSPYNLTAAWPEAVGTDMWAFCTPELNIAPHRDAADNGPVRHWVVTQYWSTKQSWRCNTFPVENPLLEPADISGDFIHEQRTASVDRFGKPLRHPNLQPITGPATEYQYSYPSISITRNQDVLPLATCVNLINKVNDAPLWGLPARKIQFIDVKFERKVYGNCFFYWRTTYVFRMDRNGFDKEIPAEGTKVYRGSGSSNDPKNYIPAKSDTDENESVPLDYRGRKLVWIQDLPDGTPQYAYPQWIQTPEILEQGNLLALGISSSLH